MNFQFPVFLLPTPEQSLLRNNEITSDKINFSVKSAASESILASPWIFRLLIYLRERKLRAALAALKTEY